MSIIIAFWFVYTPPEFFRSPFYWIGFVPSAVVGDFFLLPRGPIFPVAGKAKPKGRLGYIPIAVVAIILAAASSPFPSTLTIEFGIPIAPFWRGGPTILLLVDISVPLVLLPQMRKEIVDSRGKRKVALQQERTLVPSSRLS